MTKTLPVLLGCFALAVAATSLAAGAWADDDDREDGHELVYEAEDVEDLFEATEALVGDLVMPADALAKVAAKAKGTPLEASLGSEMRDGKLVAVWEVEVVSGETLSEWFVDARSGDVFAGETEDVGEVGTRYEKSAGAATVSMADAAGKISEHFAGAVIGLEYEAEDGAVGWEASVVHDGRLTELFVDGTTGKISVDDDDDENEDGDE